MTHTTEDPDIQRLRSLIDDLAREREALTEWRMGRVCSTCKNLSREQRCAVVGPYGPVEQPRLSAARGIALGFVINEPDDFGCNRWEAKG